MNSLATRNRVFFGLGTVGRDMLYAMINLYLVWFMTEVLNLSDAVLLVAGNVLAVLRVIDALNDPIMGMVVDNTKSRWGKFKPWLLFGAVTGSVFMVLLFTDIGASTAYYVVFFSVFYIAWDILYGLNDIAYWSMLPAITLDQKQRERVGSFAKICANVGMFIVAAGILQITEVLGKMMGSQKDAWLAFAIAVAVLTVGFQLFTLFGVREMRGDTFKPEEKTTIRGMVKAIFLNDQLLFATIATALIAIGYNTTASFGSYYFKYVFHDVGMYTVFTIIVAVALLGSLAVFPLFSRKFTRRQLYTGASALVVVSLLLFFFSPKNFIPVGIASFLLFVGEAFLQLLVLMFLADTIEYGQWKFHKRNQSVTLSVQPLINKIGGAIATAVVTNTLVISGINEATSAEAVTANGELLLKIAMMILPLVCVLLGYLVYRSKYKIDKQFYDRIVKELTERGDIKNPE